MTGINSCYEHNCETCRKYDKAGQILDEITACDQKMINNLESKGYYCKE